MEIARLLPLLHIFPFVIIFVCTDGTCYYEVHVRRRGVYGKARYSQIRRCSQIQNGLARAVFYFEGGITVLASTVNRTREGGFLYTLAYKEGGNRAS